MVKDLFKWIEVLCRSVITLIGSEWVIIFDLGGLQKKYSLRCQKSRSNLCFCNFVKSHFQYGQGLVQMNWGSMQECHKPSRFWMSDNFWSRWFTKKVLTTLSNFTLKKRCWCIFKKVIFNIVRDLFKWIEGLCRNVITLVGSEWVIVFDLGGLRKKYLLRCQISRSKTVLMQFHKKSFSIWSRTCSNELMFYVGVS